MIAAAMKVSQAWTMGQAKSRRSIKQAKTMSPCQQVKQPKVVVVVVAKGEQAPRAGRVARSMIVATMMVIQTRTMG
jgi:hypothetical protein